MKKFLALLLAVCLLPLALLPAIADETALPDGPVQIEFWSDNLLDAVYAQIVAEFEAAYADKGYTVTVKTFGGSERAQLMAAAKETNTLPDLFLSMWFTSTDFCHQGMVADVSDLSDSVKDVLYPSAYEATRINGKSYMVPLYQSYYGFLYNADLFKAAGLGAYVPENKYEITRWTLSDFENVILPALKTYFEGTEKYPMALYAGDNQADTFMLDWLCMYGGAMWTDGMSTAGSDEKVVAALETMIRWSASGYTNSDVVTRSGTETTPDFRNQKSAICQGQFATYGGNIAKMESGEIAAFDLRIAAVPQEKDGEDSVLMGNYLGGICVMGNGDADKTAVAKVFIRWLLTKNELVMALCGANYMPCFPALVESSDNPFYPELAKVESFIWDFTGNAPGYVATRSLLFPAFQAAFSKDKTAAEALADYSKGANEVIQEYLDNSVILNP